MKHTLHISIGLLLSSVLSAAEPVITCEPKKLSALPGEPLQLEIRVETEHAVPAKLSIPSVETLYLRTVETIPIQRTENGRYVQKRVVIWQGLEPGPVTLTNLTVRLQESKQKVPPIHIAVEEVEPARPPENKEVDK